MINRSKIISKYENNEKMLTFISFLENATLRPNIQIEKNDLFQNVVQSIIKHDKKSFLKLFNELKSRKPNEDSAFIYDDLLLFTLICGSKIFVNSFEWIENILELRRTPTIETKQILTTFKNILSNNLQSLDNVYSIVLVYLAICNPSLINNFYLKKAFVDSFQSKENPNSDFLIVCQMRSQVIIIDNLELIRDNKINLLTRKENTYINRVKIISNIIYYLVIVVIIWYLYTRFIQDNDFKKTFSDFNTIVGIVGASLVSLTHKKVIQFLNFIQKFIYGQNE
jgi:hypothetical protein